MKFSSSVTQSVIECLQASKSAAAASPAKSRYTLPAPVEKANAPKTLGRILLVDDDTSVRDFLAKLLRSAGYGVTCAADGEEGWDLLCADSFDVLVTDHSMPRLTGLNLIRRVRVGPLRAMPCVLVSVNIPWEEKDLLQLVFPGMALAKPFSFLELLTCLRGLLPTNDSVPSEAIVFPQETDKKPLDRPKTVLRQEPRADSPRRRLARAG